MGLLRMQLFGSVRISWEGASSDLRISRTGHALLAYLAVSRHRSHSRETLAGLFWPDHSGDRARACLNTTLWRLRQAVEPRGTARGTYLTTTPSGELAFNPDSDHWLDVAVFEQRVESFLGAATGPVTAGDVRNVENVLQLYTADLMEAFFDDWVLSERERMRLLHLKALTRLMAHYATEGADEPSLACGHHILRRDPLREDIHREIMKIHLRNGRRALAAAQYAACSDALHSLLGVTPMHETHALYVEAIGGVAHSRDAPSGLEEVLDHMEAAIQGARAVTDQLEAAARVIRRAMEGSPRSGRTGHLSSVVGRPMGREVAKKTFHGDSAETGL